MSPNLKESSSWMASESAVPASSSSAGSPSIEARLAKKLAANEPHIRAQALKKLSQWLRARAAAGLMSAQETLALWKGLYFCFWMSDKPLIQESQAQAIADLLSRAFIPNSPPAWQFARGFFLTLQREWLGLDRFRMDKFMMLVRRFLRATFAMVQRSGWTAEATQTLARDIVVESVLSPAAVKPNLGFQMHVVDVYLEELAKVAGPRITAPVLWAVVQPFARHIQNGSADARLLAHIESRIFQHLMRQSDLGIAYDEYLQGNLDETDIPSSDNEEEDDSETEVIDIASEEDEAEADAGVDEPLDPRAGGVHVTIPQLEPDFQQISRDLFEMGQAPGVSSRRRKMLFLLTKQFQKMAQGKYPLSAELSDEEQVEVPTVSTRKVIQRRQKEELANMARLREERRQFQQAMKAKKRGLTTPQADPEEMIEKAADGSDEDDEEEENEEEPVVPSPPPKKKAKVETTPGKKSKKAQKTATDVQRTPKSETKPTKMELASTSTHFPTPTSEKKRVKGKTTELESTSTEIEEPKSQKKQKNDNKVKVELSTLMTQSQKKLNKTAEKMELESPAIETQSPKSKKKLEKTPKKMDLETPASETETPKSRKKKKLKINRGISKQVEETPDTLIQTQTTATKFQEVDFDQPTKTTEVISQTVVETKKKAKRHSEPVMPSLEQSLVSQSTKKVKKQKRQSEVMPTSGISGYDAPTISAPSQASLPTPTFVKKAKSKVNTPQRSSSMSSSPQKKVLLSSEKKKLNFSLTLNKTQSLRDVDSAMMDSPEIPFCSAKKPTKGLLKNKVDISIVNTPSPISKLEVVKNTQRNSISKTAKLLNRMYASDFL